MKEIGTDFQGWPIYKLTLREVLKELGFTESEGKVSISSDSEILDAYPITLEDDGMGYGIRRKYIESADNNVYGDKDNDGDSVFNLFIAPSENEV